MLTLTSLYFNKGCLNVILGLHRLICRAVNFYETLQNNPLSNLWQFQNQYLSPLSLRAR